MKMHLIQELLELISRSSGSSQASDACRKRAITYPRLSVHGARKS